MRAAVAAILLSAVFVPTVQTWLAQMALERRPDLNASLGSLSAEFGEVDIANLRLDIDGASLALPSLRAGVPLTASARGRKLVVRSLVAKGWTLDLSHFRGLAGGPAQAASTGAGVAGAAPSTDAGAVAVRNSGRVFSGILGGWSLPCDVSLDGIELEGVVLVPFAPEKPPTRVHVRITGGGLAAGREAALDIDATSEFLDAFTQVNTVAARGRLQVSMDTPRTVNRIEIAADFSAKGGALPENLALSADVGASRDAAGESYAVALNRSGRRVATVLADFRAATNRMAGTWKVALSDSDLAPFLSGRPLPSLRLAADGRFDADAGFERVDITGHATGAVSRLGAIAPPLDRLGNLAIGVRFESSRSGHSVRIGALSASLSGLRASATARTLQPFDIDEATGALKMADPRGDWIDCSIRGPMESFLGATGPFTLAGGDVAGELVVHASDRGFSIRSQAPLAAAGVSIQGAGTTLARGLDVSVALLADYGSQGWQVQAAPLAVSRDGRRLAAIEAKASRPADSDQPIALAGTWSADVGALTSLSSLPGISGVPGRTASGDFSANIGETSDIESKVAIVGRDPGHSITASLSAGVGADGAVTFLVPVKVSLGSNASDLSAEGTWTSEDSRPRIDAKVTGENVVLEPFLPLAAPLAAALGIPLPSIPAAVAHGPGATAAPRDGSPFWGNWAGIISIDFDRVRLGNHVLANVGGAVEIGPGSVRLENGRGSLPRQRKATGDGLLTFDASAALPYVLKASAAVDGIDAASLFAAAQPGSDPLVEGRFSVAGAFSGDGRNPADLAGRTHGEVRLTGTDGIIRVLKTSVAEAIPEVATPVKDALKTAGSVVGTLFGHGTDTLNSGDNPVSKNAEAVLDFSSLVSEIGYDRLTITANQGSDRTIRLVDIEMTAPDERLSGTGRLAYAEGLPLTGRPLSLDLRLFTRGKVADLLSTAGLLSAQKDKDGFASLNQAIRLGGTLQRIDDSQWRGVLVQAATRKTGPAKEAK